jgi:UDP-N-acetylmuramate--alanine ligase
MVGIGGAGMSALARLYLQQGIAVSGSDEAASSALDDLAALGATVHTGHDAAYVGDAGLVVHSSAVPADNPELAEARRRGIRTLKHAPALGELFNTRRGIAVAGTHGKTTTTAMIAFVLERCGRQPSFHVGGELVDLDTSARWGRGDWMVIEADEFDRRFLEYRPEIAVVTNVEPDHFEYYGTVEAMDGAFADFLARVRPGGAVVACAEDARLARLLEGVADRRIVRYDTRAERAGGGAAPPVWQWWATEVEQVSGGSRFVAHTAGGRRGAQAAVRLALPGRHNVANALAALAACDLAGVPVAKSAPALAGFHGTRRRFQLAGEARGIRVYDDYAHHPTEVRTVLDAARYLVPPGGRLWAVFQPHLYVRTERLFDDFARAFDAADRVALTDVYSPSGREPAGAYRGSRELVAATGHPGATYAGPLAATRQLLARELRRGDVVLVMGAGSISQLPAQVVEDLSRTKDEGRRTDPSSVLRPSSRTQPDTPAEGGRSDGG